MRIAQRAGRFEFEAYTDGFPEWTKLIVHDGDGSREEPLRSIHPDELPDLHYAIGRMIELLAREKDDKAKRYA